MFVFKCVRILEDAKLERAYSNATWVLVFEGSGERRRFCSHSSKFSSTKTFVQEEVSLIYMISQQCMQITTGRTSGTCYQC